MNADKNDFSKLFLSSYLTCLFSCSLSLVRSFIPQAAPSSCCKNWATPSNYRQSASPCSMKTPVITIRSQFVKYDFFPGWAPKQGWDGRNTQFTYSLQGDTKHLETDSAMIQSALGLTPGIFCKTLYILERNLEQGKNNAVKRFSLPKY